MTTLLITPKVETKTAKFKGTIAAGEHVAVTIKDGAEWSDEGLMLRVIDLTTQRTLAVFPRPEETLADGEEPDSWDTNAGDLTCTLNLNTTRMVAAARHMLRVPVMFVLGNSSEDERTLYFRDCYEVELWPERIGDDTPYDLDKWPKQIDDWMEQMEDWGRQMQAFNTALSIEAEARESGDAPLSGQTINTNTTNAMRQAIKTIGAALGATMRVLAVCALPAFGASVQTAPLGDLDLDQNPSVVTNVDFSGLLTEHQDISGKADKTNTYTKAETDAAFGAFAATGSVSRAEVYGTPNRWTDATGCVWVCEYSFPASVQIQGGASYPYAGYTNTMHKWGSGEDNYVSYEPHATRWTYYNTVDGVWIGVSPIATGGNSIILESPFGGGNVTLLYSGYGPVTNIVGRVVLTNDLTGVVSMDVSKTTDESKLLNAPSLQSARVVPDPVQSAYWPNRQRVLKLGDSETVVSADRAEADWLLVRDPSRLLFVDTVTINGSETNYTFKTFQQYLNAVSPDTMQDIMRAYLPVEGGGSVTGNVDITGNLLVRGTFEAPNLVRVVTADIEANGFSVSNGVLRANSGLVVSNGMCKINCARATIGIGTPRLHIEGGLANVARNLTFGGDWDAPYFTFYGLMTNQVDILIRNYGLIDVSNATAIAAMPVVVPDYRTAGSRRIVVLENGRLNLVGDSLYGATMVLRCPNLGMENTRFDVLLDFSSAVPYIILDAGTWGESPVFLGQTDALEPSAGTPRIVHFRCLGGDRWIVTYDDLTSWMPTTNVQEEEEP